MRKGWDGGENKSWVQGGFSIFLERALASPLFSVKKEPRVRAKFHGSIACHLDCHHASVAVGHSMQYQMRRTLIM
jgi:hypothetical protein